MLISSAPSTCESVAQHRSVTDVSSSVLPLELCILKWRTAYRLSRFYQQFGGLKAEEELSLRSTAITAPIFVGGNREHRQAIAEWNQQQIIKDLRQRGIDWHFNAPHSSESGGIWERQIRTIRKVLCSITSSITFTDEQLLTLMAEAERVVNNRPLSHVGDDSSTIITPSMLLTLKSDSCLPPGVFSPDDHYTVRRYRQAQYLASVFWQRFMRHYLPSLQARQKWQRSSGNVRVGDVVLLIESTPRGLWPLARVTKVNVSRDGYIRSCEVFSRGSSLTRPISKIVLLEAAK